MYPKPWLLFLSCIFQTLVLPILIKTFQSGSYSRVILMIKTLSKPWDEIFIWHNLVKSVHFKKKMRESPFFQNHGTFNTNQNKKYHNFVRDKICATAFLKRTLVLFNFYLTFDWKYHEHVSCQMKIAQNTVLKMNGL